MTERRGPILILPGKTTQDQAIDTIMLSPESHKLHRLVAPLPGERVLELVVEIAPGDLPAAWSGVMRARNDSEIGHWTTPGLHECCANPVDDDLGPEAQG